MGAGQKCFVARSEFRGTQAPPIHAFDAGRPFLAQLRCAFRKTTPPFHFLGQDWHQMAHFPKTGFSV